MLRRFWVGALILGACLTGFSKPLVNHKLKKHHHGIPLSKNLWAVASPLKTLSSLSHYFPEASETRISKPLEAPFSASISDLKTETSNRNHLANRVLRGRMDHFLKTQMAQCNRPDFDLVQKKIDKVNDVELFSSDSQNPSSDKKTFSTLKVGIDLRNEHSKIEYLEEDFELGLYHSRTLSALSGKEPFSDNLRVSLNKKWEEQKLKAYLNFPFSLPYYMASISRDFSASFSSTLSAQAPLKGTDQAKKVELKFSFLF